MIIHFFINYLTVTLTFTGILLVVRWIIYNKNLKKEDLFHLLTKEGTTKNVIPGGYGEFGLEITNPIPIHTHFELEDYLYNLITINGEHISFNRIGSGTAPNIKNPIDVYEIFIDHNFYKKLYLCPYHKKTSKKIPKGFKNKYIEYTNKDLVANFLAMLLVQVLFTFYYLFFLEIGILEYSICLIINSFWLPFVLPKIIKKV
ncbi:hypothetical protein [Polaribacter sp.]|uniref:hypothetical protein n=1 Tax=Polaribacter sp. TaxID=1920175 RepID=UPI0040480F37